MMHCLRFQNLRYMAINDLGLRSVHKITKKQIKTGKQWNNQQVLPSDSQITLKCNHLQLLLNFMITDYNYNYDYFTKVIMITL